MAFFGKNAYLSPGHTAFDLPAWFYLPLVDMFQAATLTLTWTNEKLCRRYYKRLLLFKNTLSGCSTVSLGFTLSRLHVMMSIERQKEDSWFYPNWGFLIYSHCLHTTCDLKHCSAIIHGWFVWSTKYKEILLEVVNFSFYVCRFYGKRR